VVTVAHTPILRLPGDDRELPLVDVAIVMESTYPFLKGGVSAVVHDIITHNPDLTFGIIHIAWDTHAPAEDLYGMPANVQWVDVLYLSLEENGADFRAAVENPREDQQVTQFIDAIQAALTGHYAPLRQLYLDAVNPQTRTWRLWSVLVDRRFMEAAVHATRGATDISLGELFWLMRDFFSLAYSLLDRVHPPARVYHAHTTGYASLVSAAAKIQNDGAFLLTEHNLYVRDTVNTLLDRPMNLPVTMQSHELHAGSTVEKFWTRWWTVLGAMLYPETDHITYLYPNAITEAADLGGDRSKSEILPNGIVWEEFDYARARRREALETLDTRRTWRLACIARVVPIKGIIELIDAVALLVERGVDNVVVDVLGPTEHVPEYYEQCLARIREHGLEGRVTLRGTVAVRDVLHDYDALILASFNEGQPVVVLESMVIGLPVLGTDVGGMDQLVIDHLTDTDGRTIGPCGDLVQPGDVAGLADMVERMVADPDLYRTWSANALDRLRTVFLMESIMVRYNAIYRRLGAQPERATRTADLGRGPGDITDGPYERYPEPTT